MLGRTYPTNWHQHCQQTSTCRQSRRSQNSDWLWSYSCGLLWSQHKNYLWVQWMFFHGCTTCFQNRDQRHPKLNDRTMRVHHSTMQRLHHFQAFGYNVNITWECLWQQFKQTFNNLYSPFYWLNVWNPETLFWWTCQCHSIVLPRRTQWRNTIRRLHLPIPLGKQTLSLPSRTSSNH